MEKMWVEGRGEKTGEEGRKRRVCVEGGEGGGEGGRGIASSQLLKEIGFSPQDDEQNVRTPFGPPLISPRFHD
eukprot:768052-Hanusia_phi.AAC.1